MVRVLRVIEYSAEDMEDIQRHLALRAVKDSVKYGHITIREAFIGGPFGMYEKYTQQVDEVEPLDDIPP